MTKQKAEKGIDPLGGSAEPDDIFGVDLGGMDLDDAFSLDDADADDDERPSIEERAKTARGVVDETIAERRAKEQAVRDRLDMGFFFSVVFPTRKDRDQWLSQRNITLRADEYLLPTDLKGL